MRWPVIALATTVVLLLTGLVLDTLPPGRVREMALVIGGPALTILLPVSLVWLIATFVQQTDVGDSDDPFRGQDFGHENPHGVVVGLAILPLLLAPCGANFQRAGTAIDRMRMSAARPSCGRRRTADASQLHWSGQSTVVLETGAGTPGAIWDVVQPRIATATHDQNPFQG